MADDKVLLIYESNLGSIIAQQEELQKEIKTTDEVAKQSGKKVEDSFKGAGLAADSLKTQYRKLKEELANATDPKQIQKLAAEAGKLKDKLDDATDAAKVFASESKFEQIGNAIGSIAGKLRNLDFKGAADQGKLLVSVVQSITFKEAIGGIKDFGSTMVSLGKSLLTNPIFLIGATIAGVGFAVYDLSQSFNKLGQESKITTESLAETNKQLLIYADRSKLANIAIKESIGLITKGQAETLRNEIKNTQAITELKEKYAADILALAKDLNVNLTDSEQGYFDENYRLNYDDLVNRKNFNRQKQELEIAFNTQLRILRATQRQEDSAVAIKESAEKIKQQKELIAKSREELKKFEKEKPKDTFDLKAFLGDTRPEDQAYYEELKRRQDAIDQTAKDWMDAEAEITDITERESKERQAIIDNEKKERIEAQKGIIDASILLSKELLSAVNELSQRALDSKIDELQAASDSENEILKARLDRDEISQSQYDAQRLENEKKLKVESDELKRKAFETNRQITLIQTIISTAQATVAALGSIPYTPANIALAAATAAAGAVQIALIESQKAPKFAKGVIDLKGKGTGTSDEIPAWLSAGESVIKADATKRTKPLLKSINEGNEFKYIQEYYVAPALKSQIKKMEQQKDKSFAENVANSFILKQQLNDKNLLKSLEKSRKNDNTIARFLGSKLDQAVTNKRQW